MAEIPMKTLKFHGLDDTYTIDPLIAYPIGSIYVSVNATSPATLVIKE